MMVHRRTEDPSISRTRCTIVRDAKILRESIQEFPGPVAVYDADDILIACNELYRWVHGNAFERVAAAAAGHGRIRYADLIRKSAAGVVPPEEIDAHIAEHIRAQRLADGTPVDRYYPNRGWFRIVKIRTPTGTGDAFAGCLAAALDRGDAIPDALRYASVGAGLTCQRTGTQGALPTNAEIEDALPTLPASRRLV